MGRRKNRRIALLPAVVFLAVLSAGRAFAYVPVAVEVQCPIDGARVQSWEMASGYQSCLRLDLKPVGAIPAPPPIHECPNDHYVWHRGDLAEAEVASVREWIHSEAYRRLQSESAYFRLARIYERAGRGPREIAHALLRASWEVEAQPDRYERYLEEAHAQLVRHLQTAAPAKSEAILAGELERLLGRFDAARARFEKLRREPTSTTPIEKRIVDYELELVSRQDREPHYVPQDGVDEARCRSNDHKRGAD